MFCSILCFFLQRPLNLDPKDQSRALPPLSLAVGASGYDSQSHSNNSSSLPSPSADPSDRVLMSTGQWGEPLDEPLLSQEARAGVPVRRPISIKADGSGTAVEAKYSLTNAATQTKLSGNFIVVYPFRYKTELCRSFATSGKCKYNSKCQFAHGHAELRRLNRHPRYKTQLCRTFHNVGFCPYGMRCHFLHNIEGENPNSIPYSPSPLFSPPSSSGTPLFSTSIWQCRQSPSHLNSPPLVSQSFGFAGFPSAQQQCPQTGLGAPPFHAASLPRAPSASPALGDLFFPPFPDLIDYAFEACPTSSLSYNSPSDPDQDTGSTPNSGSGSEACGVSQAGSRRLAVFSQLADPEGATSFCS